MHSVEGTFLSLELSAVVMAEIPNWLSISGNTETTSNETKMASSGKGPCLLSSSIFCKKCVVSLTKENVSGLMVLNKIQEVISLSGLFCLWVLIVPKALPGLASFLLTLSAISWVI